ncbi:hypothetical protein MSIM_49630 [Mycobacterium simiae]|nr:hypothetical protein MSIM_49630 [Mycobacterium simiae]
MPIRFMTDANVARRNGNSWNSAMRFTSYNTMGQRDHAFRNIVNTLLGVRDQLLRDATKYEGPWGRAPRGYPAKEFSTTYARRI